MGSHYPGGWLNPGLRICNQQDDSTEIHLTVADTDLNPIHAKKTPTTFSIYPRQTNLPPHNHRTKPTFTHAKPGNNTRQAWQCTPHIT